MHNPARILIVDDNEANRDILATRLAAHGYQVAEAADGEEALAAAYQYLPDLILLDVMMPKVDGLYLARCMKSDPGLRTVPIIFLTGLSDPRDIISGIQAGARSYLVKPFRTDELLEKVRKAVRSSVTTP